MRALWELARRQLGLLTKAQAVQLVTINEFRTLARRGHLRPIRRGVWVDPGAPATYEQSVLAALLAAGADALASHLTAGRLHGLRVPRPERIDVLTLPHRRMKVPGVEHHRSRLIRPFDIARVGAVPVTSVARTLVDCTPWLPGPDLGRAVDDARRRGLVTATDVERAHGHLDRGSRTGRRRVAPLRPVVADRHDAGGSDLELDVLEVLSSAGLPPPVQQHPIVVAGTPRSLDFAYPDQRIYIEFDGFAEHGLIRSTFDDDRERNSELALLGWLGLHVTSNTRPADLIDRVARALQ